jgi:hypothetical protein
MRTPEVAGTDEAREAVRDLFSSYRDKVQFSLADANLDIDTGLERETQVYGEYYGPDKLAVTSIHIKYQTFEPLLNNKITDAERMLCQFELAATLLHESAVKNHFFSFMIFLYL